MKVLLVKNGSRYNYSFFNFFAFESVDERDIKNLEGINPDEYDLIVLTGSDRYPIVYSENTVATEVQLVLNSKTPIIGICYGCELINYAFGGTLEDKGAEKRMKGITHLQIVSADFPFLQKYNGLEVYENHRWICDTIADSFEVIAMSKSCPQIIKHKEREIWGIQFHPEKKTVLLNSDDLFIDLIQSFSKKLV